MKNNNLKMNLYRIESGVPEVAAWSTAVIPTL